MKRLALEGGAMAAELNEAFERGGEGAAALAEAVVAAADAAVGLPLLYELDDAIDAKIEAICKRVYGADGVVFLPAARRRSSSSRSSVSTSSRSAWRRRTSRSRTTRRF